MVTFLRLKVEKEIWLKVLINVKVNIFINIVVYRLEKDIEIIVNKNISTVKDKENSMEDEKRVIDYRIYREVNMI